MLGRERSKAVSQEIISQTVGGAHADDSGDRLRCVPNTRTDLEKLALRTLCGREQRLARGRERTSGRMSLEQLGLDTFLQRGELPSNGRMIQPQMFRRLQDLPGTSDFQKDANPLPIHRLHFPHNGAATLALD